MAKQRNHLQQMILNDVANCTDFLVEAAAALHAERFRHGDLHVLDVLAIPYRFEEGVREAKIQQVLHRLLAQIMIDSEDRLLREHLVQRGVERLRSRQVAPERLLDDHSRVVGAAGLRQAPGPRSQTCSGEWRDSVWGGSPDPIPCAAGDTSRDPRSRRRHSAAAPTSFAKHSGSNSPACSRLWRARSRSFSRSQPARAMPMIGICRPSRCTMA